MVNAPWGVQVVSRDIRVMRHGTDHSIGLMGPVHSYLDSPDLAHYFCLCARLRWLGASNVRVAKNLHLRT